MLLSQLIEHMQSHMGKHGDHEVWLESSYGNYPYGTERFRFTKQGYDDIPESTYVI